MPGANSPCPCGSGKKYKKCCREKDSAPGVSRDATPPRPRTRVRDPGASERGSGLRVDSAAPLPRGFRVGTGGGPPLDSVTPSTGPRRFPRAVETRGGAPEPETGERSIRVFVSSTFLDMQEEREELVKVTFPQLRKLCESRGVSWGEVDLRWGITDEQKAEGKVLPICLAEIQNCRPYFIGILGERYGWVPDELPAEAVQREPWLRENLERSVTELEILHGVLNNPSMARHAFFYFRDPGYVESVPVAARPKFREDPLPEEIRRLGREEARRRAEARATRLGALKRAIRGSGFPVRESYRDPKALGRLVLADLESVIEQRFPAGSEPDPLAREAAAHAAFARSRFRSYVDRPGYYDRLDSHTAASGPPLVVIGASGLGKSALLANWSERHREAHPRVPVLTHFIGATAESTDWSAMLRRLLGELSRRFDLDLEIPDEPQALRSAFESGLRQVGAEARAVLVIDALDQLEDRDGAPDLVWLPTEVPGNIRLIVSTLPGRPLDVLRDRAWPDLEVRPLEVDERERLTVEYLGQYRKALDPERVRQIASAPQTASPLFLRALLEELRLWGDHATLEARIRHYLGAATPVDLFDLILERYEEDYDADRPGLVRAAMALTWASRRGLSQAELLELLGDDTGPLPGAYWSPLFLAVEASLVSRSGLLAFSHEHIAKAVEARYLPTAEARRAAHRRLAGYFAGEGVQSGEFGPRMLEELPWQLAAAEEWDSLTTVLGMDSFLGAAWRSELGRLDVRRAWARLEETGRKIEETYRAIIENPGEKLLTASIVRTLLTGAGRVQEALELDRTLLDHYETPEFADRVAQLRDEWTAASGHEEREAALEVLSEGQPLLVADRLEQMAHAQVEQGNFEEALDLLERAQAGWKERSDERALARVLELKADVHLAAGDIKSAERFYEEAEQLFRATGRDAEVEEVQLSRSRVLHARGRTREALELARVVERERRASTNRMGLAAVLSDLGILHSELGERREALAALEEAERIERDLGQRRGVANTLNIRASLLEASGDLTSALDVWREAETISRDTGDRPTLALVLFNQARAGSRVPGGRTEAEGKCEEAARLFDELHDYAHAVQAGLLKDQIEMGLYRHRWRAWALLFGLGAVAAILIFTGIRLTDFRRWFWLPLGSLLALIWVQMTAAALIPPYRAFLMRLAYQLGGELRLDREESRERRPEN